MADEQQQPEATGTPPTASAPAPAPQVSPAAQERIFTQTELNHIVGREVAKERERLARRAPEPEAKQGEAPKGEDPKPDELGRLNEQLNTLAARLEESEFAAKVAGLAITAEQRDVLRKLWNPAAPEAMDAAIKAFGVGAPKPAAIAPAPVYSPGPAHGAPEGSMERDATKWSKDYIDQLRASGEFKAKLEEYRNSLPGGGADLFRRRIPKAG